MTRMVAIGAVVGFAATIIVLVWLLTWFEPVSRFLLGERGQQIKNMRREIKEDAKAEADTGCCCCC